MEQAVSMPDSVWAKGAPLFRCRQFEADEFLLHAGEVSVYIYFLLSGVVRQFYLTPDGKQFNKSFSVEHEPCGAFHSSLTQTPSRFSIQALEATQLLQVRFEDLTTLFEQDSHWNQLGRKSAEQQALWNEEREAQFLLDSATDRYLRFRQQFPGLEEHIAQYHVASYLGITNVALSRIRRKLRDEKMGAA